MYDNIWRTLCVSCAIFFVVGGALAADFTCLDHQCERASFVGKIEAGDAERFSVFLEGNPNIELIYFHSAGGNAVEGIKMGRLLRQRFVAARASIYPAPPEKNHVFTRPAAKPVKPVMYCASSCALVYFGASAWNAKDTLGLHRPSSTELGALSLSEARHRLEEVRAKIGSYLRDMEVETIVFETMFATPPEKLAFYPIASVGSSSFAQHDSSCKAVEDVARSGFPPGKSVSIGGYTVTDQLWNSLSVDERLSIFNCGPLAENRGFRYPTSIHDWLFAKCASTKLPLPDCMESEFSREQYHRWLARRPQKQH